MKKATTDVEQRIVHWLDDDVTFELDVPEVIAPQLEPRLQRRRDVEWLGIIRRAEGKLRGAGPLESYGRTRGNLRSISTLRPQIAAMVSAALDEEIRAIMQKLDGSDAKDCGRSNPPEVSLSQESAEFHFSMQRSTFAHRPPEHSVSLGGGGGRSAAPLPRVAFVSCRLVRRADSANRSLLARATTPRTIRWFLRCHRRETNEADCMPSATAQAPGRVTCQNALRSVDR